MTKTRAMSCWVALLASCTIGVVGAQAEEAEVRLVFSIKYAIDGAAYLDAGRNAGLSEGMRLEVRRAPAGAAVRLRSTGALGPIVAQLQIHSTAETSAVCDVLSSTEVLRRGDQAYLVPESVERIKLWHAANTKRKYLQVITFTEGDPLDEEVREAVVRPPLPEINRARGRIGFEYSGIFGRGDMALNSSQYGLVVRTDLTRIGGTHWNLSGYWRGRLSSRSGSQPETLTDLMNRTYHLSLNYENPQGHWVAGFGRLDLPWAASLNTIDGGYLGRRAGKHATVGIFAGSTPDPTSWNYNPDRRLAGAFTNFEGGSFDRFRYTSTAGVAVSAIEWRADRQFIFTENGFFYKRSVALYHSLQADRPKGAGPNTPDAAISRSYLTLRFQPHSRLALDVSHNYFRDLPTFETRLVGTGLLDNLLFEGFSGGARLELPKRVTLYGNLGRSSRTGDARSSLNQLYGITFGNILRSGVRADLRHSTFNGSFGYGSYNVLALSRNFGNAARFEVQGGRQMFTSPLTKGSRSEYLMTTMDASIGTHYFIQGGYTMQRGEVQEYDQVFTTFGYRFDSRSQR